MPTTLASLASLTSLTTLAALVLTPTPVPAQTTLSPTEQRIRAAAEGSVGEAIALIERTVNVNSGTLNVAGVRAVGEMYRPVFEALGFTVRWADVPAAMGRAGHLIAERQGSRGKRILVIGHLDTVFEPSSPFQRFRRDSTRLFGPGAGDMKGGNAIAIHALAALKAAGALDGAQVTVILTGDEELPGEPVSEARAALVALAKRSDVALDFEGLVTDQQHEYITVARRSSTTWTLEVTGRGAHSSGIFGEGTGAGAIYEASRILQAFYTELRSEPGATFSPGVIVGGTDVAFSDAAHRGEAFGKDNVVAQKVVVSGDIRTLSDASLERVRARMREIAARNLPRTSATLTFREGYPAMAPTDGNRRLAALLNDINSAAGYPAMPLLDPVRRGAGDISFVAQYVDGLAGLGVSGGGDHTEREFVDVATMGRQIGRAALLMYRLINGPPKS